MFHKSKQPFGSQDSKLENTNIMQDPERDLNLSKSSSCTIEDNEEYDIQVTRKLYDKGLSKKITKNWLKRSEFNMISLHISNSKFQEQILKRLRNADNLEQCLVNIKFEALQLIETTQNLILATPEQFENHDDLEGSCKVLFGIFFENIQYVTNYAAEVEQIIGRLQNLPSNASLMSISQKLEAMNQHKSINSASTEQSIPDIEENSSKVDLDDSASKQQLVQNAGESSSNSDSDDDYYRIDDILPNILSTPKSLTKIQFKDTDVKDTHLDSENANDLTETLNKKQSPVNLPSNSKSNTSTTSPKDPVLKKIVPVDPTINEETNASVCTKETVLNEDKAPNDVLDCSKEIASNDDVELNNDTKGTKRNVSGSSEISGNKKQKTTIEDDILDQIVGSDDSNESYLGSMRSGYIPRKKKRKLTRKSLKKIEQLVEDEEAVDSKSKSQDDPFQNIFNGVSTDRLKLCKGEDDVQEQIDEPPKILKNPKTKKQDEDSSDSDSNDSTSNELLDFNKLSEGNDDVQKQTHEATEIPKNPDTKKKDEDSSDSDSDDSSSNELLDIVPSPLSSPNYPDDGSIVSLDNDNSQRNRDYQLEFFDLLGSDGNDSSSSSSSSSDDEEENVKKAKRSTKKPTEVSSEDDDFPETSDVEMKGEENLDKPKNKTGAWRRDSLLVDPLTSESEDEMAEKKNKRSTVADNKELDIELEEENLEKKRLQNEERLEQVMDKESDEVVGITSGSESSSIEFVSDTKNRKKKTKTSTQLEEEEEDDDKKGPGRRNIRSILSEENLQISTIKANEEEKKRVERLTQAKEAVSNVLSQQVSLSVDDSFIIDAAEEYLIKVDNKLSKKLKVHQKEGVKFMWDACFESVKAIKEGNKGAGCILAHCMGLGKTFQVIALIHTLFRYNSTGIKHVLVICPLSTVQNWNVEIKSAFKLAKEKVNKFDVYTINGAQQSIKDRLYTIRSWKNSGKGILLVGYDSYIALVKHSQKTNNVDAYKALTDEAEGPQIVFCDEGHLLKSGKTNRTKVLSKIETKRRVILTGTPMQNNLVEYFHMVQFVKPNLLGTFSEFSNRFVGPIDNGQYSDSTKEDIKLMKQRSHILNRCLKNTVQRYEETELQGYLPEKIDFVIYVNLTPVQIPLYQRHMDHFKSNDNDHKKLFAHHLILQAICTHPLALHIKEQEQDKRKGRKEVDTIVPNDERYVVDLTEPKGWWKDDLPKDWKETSEYGSKITVMLSIINESIKVGDKILIFSSSLIILDTIEEIFKNVQSNWHKDRDYLRMDGTVSPNARQQYCNKFNQYASIKIFLISTKVGGLGLNLAAANRVILMDVGYNPSQDLQSIFRVYRFGQKKKCYIYRMVAKGTMEEVIYERAITKQALSGRVVDEVQSGQYFKSGEISSLYRNNMNYGEIPVHKLPLDKVLANTLQNHKHIICNYHEHKNLLTNHPNEELDEEEIAAAWDAFNREKENVSLLREKESLPHGAYPYPQNLEVFLPPTVNATTSMLSSMPQNIGNFNNYAGKIVNKPNDHAIKNGTNTIRNPHGTIYRAPMMVTMNRAPIMPRAPIMATMNRAPLMPRAPIRATMNRAPIMPRAPTMSTAPIPVTMPTMSGAPTMPRTPLMPKMATIHTTEKIRSGITMPRAPLLASMLGDPTIRTMPRAIVPTPPSITSGALTITTTTSAPVTSWDSSIVATSSAPNNQFQAFTIRQRNGLKIIHGGLDNVQITQELDHVRRHGATANKVILIEDDSDEDRPIVI